MSYSLAEKRILITGASSGIGAACAEVISHREARVFIGDINQQAGETLANALKERGADVAFALVDVSQADSVLNFHRQAISFLGKIDVAINNAGIDHKPAAMLDVPDETFHQNICVNLAGIWYCMKQQLTDMLANGGGHIINLASVAGLHSAPSLSAYAAAKHGVVGLSKSVAVEYARANIRVNAVCPSFIRTPMVENVMANFGQEYAHKLVKANPMKRLGEAQEIANAIAWLCTDESSFMTGHSVVLDGGMLA